MKRTSLGDDSIKESNNDTGHTKVESPNINKNVCVLNLSEQLVLPSLSEYKNRFFMSNNPLNLMEFYSRFRNVEEIIQWMRERPKGTSYIHEFEGNKEIIVVIPTANINGTYAKNCRETIFKSLHIIFVESAEIGDPFFNYAHNVNIGVSLALKYKPKWIIISNDDIFSIEPIENLVKEIKKIDEHRIDSIFITDSPHHSVLSELAEPRRIRRILHWLHPNKAFRYLIDLEDKFKIRYLSVAKFTLFGLLFFKRGYRFIQGMDFFVISSHYAKLNSGNLFDDIFINTYEDVDLSLKLSFNPDRLARVNYKIGDYYGKSLGKITNRMLRDFAGEVYINYKVTHDYSSQLLEHLNKKR